MKGLEIHPEAVELFVRKDKVESFMKYLKNGVKTDCKLTEELGNQAIKYGAEILQKAYERVTTQAKPEKEALYEAFNEVLDFRGATTLAVRGFLAEHLKHPLNEYVIGIP